MRRHIPNTITGMARRAASSAYTALNAKKLAAAMVDPKGRQALLQLQTLPDGSAKARELTAFLAAIHAAQSASDTPGPSKAGASPVDGP